MKFSGLTISGQNHLAQLQATKKPIEFSKIVFGDGTITENDKPVEFVRLKKEIVSKGILEKQAEENTLILTTTIDNIDLQEGYFLRETGIYIRDEDREILYYYINDGDEVSWMPPETDGPHRMTIKINLVASSTGSILSEGTGKDLFITKEFLEDHYEPKFDKNNGFNLPKTDKHNLDSSLILATAKAVKTAFDLLCLKIDAIKLTWTSLSNKPDFYNGVDSRATNQFATPKAVKTAYDKGTEALNEANSKVSKNGDTMTGRLTLETHRPYLEFNDTRTGNVGGYIGFGTSKEKTLQIINRHDDGVTQITAPNLTTKSKEVVGAINELNADKETRFISNDTRNSDDYAVQGLSQHYQSSLSFEGEGHGAKQILNINYSYAWKNQMAFDYNGNAWIRGRDNSKEKWSDWNKVATEPNFKCTNDWGTEIRYGKSAINLGWNNEQVWDSSSAHLWINYRRGKNSKVSLIKFGAGEGVGSDTNRADIEIGTLYAKKGIQVKGSGAVNGNLTVLGEILSNNDITAFSDRRLKSDFCKINNALERINKVNGYIYTMNGARHSGVIAQEIQEILPEVVKERELNGQEYLTVAYGNMAGLFIEAIKELNSKIEKLEKEVSKAGD